MTFRRPTPWPLGAFLALLALGLFAAATPAEAALQININRGSLNPMPIAISNFDATTPAMTETGANIAGVVRNDLGSSGLFRPIAPAAFVQTAAAMRVTPNFGDWRAINAQALVTGLAEMTPDGRLHVEFRLWDIYSSQQLVGFQYFTTPENWRRIAHLVSDAIYKALTGEEGYFDSRIAYVAETGPYGRRATRIAIMDEDGANNRYLTGDRNLVLTPRFSPNQQEITYLAYINNRPRVYLMNVATGQREVLGDFPGMTFAPRFSPDGNRVIMSMSLQGETNIYTMDLRTRAITRLTDDAAIDTSPCYSPNGNHIVFTSDRGGSPQIYIMNADGSNPHRITFSEGDYETPAWSPKGNWIAFTKIYHGTFYIGVIHPDGSGERLLSESFLDEGPTWAPNGQVIMFWRETPGSGPQGQGTHVRLWSVNLSGYNLRQVVTPTDAEDPDWSSLGSVNTSAGSGS